MNAERKRLLKKRKMNDRNLIKGHEYMKIKNKDKKIRERNKKEKQNIENCVI